MILLVRAGRLELPRPLGQQILSLPRLPFRHARLGAATIRAAGDRSTGRGRPSKAHRLCLGDGGHGTAGMRGIERGRARAAGGNRGRPKPAAQTYRAGTDCPRLGRSASGAAGGAKHRRQPDLGVLQAAINAYVTEHNANPKPPSSGPNPPKPFSPHSPAALYHLFESVHWRVRVRAYSRPLLDSPGNGPAGLAGHGPT